MDCPQCGMQIAHGAAVARCPRCGSCLVEAARDGDASPRLGTRGVQSARIPLGARPVTVGDIAEVLGCPRRIVLPADARREQGCDHRMIEVVGAGGMGKVYAARQTAVQRVVALKRMVIDALRKPTNRTAPAPAGL